MHTVGAAHIISTSNELCAVLGFFLINFKTPSKRLYHDSNWKQKKVTIDVNSSETDWWGGQKGAVYCVAKDCCWSR